MTERSVWPPREPAPAPAPEKPARPKAAPRALPDATPSSFVIGARKGGAEFASGAFEILPDDAAALDRMALGLWVGGAGDLHVVLRDGSDGTLAGVPAGTLLPLLATQVFATGTTATLLVCLR